MINLNITLISRLKEMTETIENFKGLMDQNILKKEEIINVIEEDLKKLNFELNSIDNKEYYNFINFNIKAYNEILKNIFFHNVI